MVEVGLVEMWTALFCVYLSWMKIGFEELMGREAAAAEEAVVMVVVMMMLKRVAMR